MTLINDGSLIYLQSNASTPRTLNLLAVWRRYREFDEYISNPFFENSALNKSIIVRHRLHLNERRLFSDGRYHAMKIILPIDTADLRSGGRSFFIGQRGYEDLLAQVLTATERASARDEELMDKLSTISSLDPFVLRERLKSFGYTPAQCYFDITEADARRMLQFIRTEIGPLIAAGFGGRQDNAQDLTNMLATKILSNEAARELEPLRISLDMDRARFAEGLFCWKGFMYYKWALIDLLPKIAPMLEDLATIKPMGPIASDQRDAIKAHRDALPRAIATACAQVRQTLQIYADAFTAMTRDSNPVAFRNFLFSAPGMFDELGDRLSAVQHVVSFWNDRHPKGGLSAITIEDLMDILLDFESALTPPSVDTVEDIPIKFPTGALTAQNGVL